VTWWRAVVVALSHREKGTSLAIFRILVGLTIAGELLTTRLSGAMAFLWFSQTEGGFKAEVSSSHWLFAFLGGPTGANVELLWAVAWVSSIAIVLGIGTRGFAAVALFSLQGLLSLQPASGGGHDRLMTIALVGLVLASSDATLSLWSRLRRGQWISDERVHAWPRYLGMWQLTVVYVFTGAAKANPNWLPPGRMDAVYQMLLLPTWSRGSWEHWIGPLYPLTQLGTVVTVLWEISWFVVPLALLWRASGRRLRFDPRPLYLGLGLLVHGTLWVMVNLGPFTPITLSFYVLVYRPDEILPSLFSSRTPDGEGLQ